MSDFDDPKMRAKPGKFYVDEDSTPDFDDLPDIRYTDGTNLFDIMVDKLGPKLPTMKPLTGRQRIK